MEREEMLEKLKRGEDPLELSIQKWADIKRTLFALIEAYEPKDVIMKEMKKLEQGVLNCALCETYNRRGIAYRRFECRRFFFWKCPIYKRSGKIGCRETPYIRFRCALYMKNIPEMLDAVIDEELFLESLRR